MRNLSPLYYQRMMGSLGDKKLLILRIDQDSKVILDIGGADGAFSEKVQEVFPNARVIVVEPVHEAAEKARRKGLEVVEAYAHQLEDHFDENSVDVVIASSVIHEIFSYGDNAGRLFQVSEFLRASRKVLKFGGKLLVRDGVNPGEQYQITLSNGNSC